MELLLLRIHELDVWIALLLQFPDIFPCKHMGDKPNCGHLWDHKVSSIYPVEAHMCVVLTPNTVGASKQHTRLTK
jgi:hypothetical protein